MRLVRVLVPDRDGEQWLSVLDDRDIDYVITDESGDRDSAMLVEFPVPTPAVNVVMDDLREAGLDEEYTVVTSAEMATTENFDTLQQRFSGDQDDSIDRTEIRGKAFTMTPNRLTYYAMTVLSAIVATAGLLLDSPAIVVGAMVIAPQVSAALTASVGTVLNDRAMIVSGFRSLAGGLLVAVVGATAFAWVIRAMYFVPPTLDVQTVAQINQRMSPGILAVAVGAGAGAAGAFGLATAFPMSIVGVMIAAALIPAAAAIGVGIAWGLPSVAIGAAVLVLVNVILISLSAILVLWYLGYRPAHTSEWEPREWLSVDRFGWGLASLAVLATLLAVSGGILLVEVGFDREVNQEIETILAEDTYDDLELVSAETQFADFGFDEEDRRVSIVINRPADQDFPNLADRLESRIADRTGTDVQVEIEYLEKDYASSD